MSPHLEMHRLTRLYEMLARVNQAIVRTRSRQELLTQACRIAIDPGPFAAAWIACFDPASSSFPPQSAFGEYAPLLTSEFIGSCCRGLEVLRSGVHSFVPDLSCSPCEIVRELRLRACVTYPLRLKGESCAVLILCASEPLALSPLETGLLAEVASDLSSALDALELDRLQLTGEYLPQENDQYYRLVLENALDGFYLVDITGKLLEVNDAYCSMSGYTRPELLQMRISDLESAESATDVAEHTRRIIHDGKDRFESRHRRKNGIVMDIETSVRFQDVDGGRLFCFLRDITDAKRAAQALRDSEERFRSVVEGSPVSILIQSDGIYRYLNPAAIAMFGGQSAEQFVGKYLFERVHPENRASVKERIRVLQEDRQVVPFMEERLHRLDGSLLEAEVSAKPFFYEGRAASIVFLRDITERKQQEDMRIRLEQQLLQSQKMEAVGRLAGGIAHDFNNLLMVIQSYTEMLQDDLPANDALRKNTQAIMKAAERAASLTGQMLAFSRKQIVSPVVLDLNEVVNETARMLRRLIGEDITFSVNPAPGLWLTEVDSDQFVQVLMNLCVNSRDAMPRGGTLTIATANDPVKESTPGRPPFIIPGDYVSLSVSDTGCGISRELQDQIFEPFFTTKEVGKGTGLGLATVYGIVKQSGGYILVESEVGLGTRFTIYLPRCIGKLAADNAARHAPQPHGSETLLLAEDEDALREAMCHNLRSLGYTVLTASSGREALAVVSSHLGSIDLLITDVVMPHMSGRELSQMLRIQRPGVKTIYMSGYTDDAVLRHGVHEQGTTFLQKPFSLASLARKVRETLQ